jgi:hypothetical protein
MHKKVGYPFDGDFQGLENWITSEEALEVLKRHNLTTNFNALVCHKGTFFDSKDRQYEVKTDRTLFYLIERGSGEVRVHLIVLCFIKLNL